MGMLDFLFYYMTGWFEKHKNRLRWSTPLQRSCYGIGLGSVSFISSINDIIHYTIFKHKNYSFPKLLFLFIALGLMQLYSFIYIEKKRFEKINPDQFKLVKFISERNREIITLIIVFLLIISSGFVFMFFIPFGGHMDHPR